MALATNQNWFGSSFLNPLNIGNFIVLTILTCGGGGGSTSEDEGESGEVGGGVGGGGIRGILCLIRWIVLCSETFASSSLSPHRGEIKGLVFGPLFPSLL